MVQLTLMDKDCKTRTNKTRVRAMSTEVKTTRAGAWRPIKRSSTSNPTPGICSMEMVTHHNKKMGWRTIAYVTLTYDNLLTAFILPRQVENLHPCRLLQPYHGAPNHCIPLAHRHPMGITNEIFN
ncbi:hypothetical protein TNCV_4992471 [Trichonephila clavipes]|nr:hypothetical protein TNCV_4992471 [Trichonephila clavipes]